jgi:hypothetical protein
VNVPHVAPIRIVPFHEVPIGTEFINADGWIPGRRYKKIDANNGQGSGEILGCYWDQPCLIGIENIEDITKRALELGAAQWEIATLRDKIQRMSEMVGDLADARRRELHGVRQHRSESPEEIYARFSREACAMAMNAQAAFYRQPDGYDTAMKRLDAEVARCFSPNLA